MLPDVDRDTNQLTCDLLHGKIRGLHYRAERPTTLAFSLAERDGRGFSVSSLRLLSFFHAPRILLGVPLCVLPPLAVWCVSGPIPYTGVSLTLFTEPITCPAFLTRRLQVQNLPSLSGHVALYHVIRLQLLVIPPSSLAGGGFAKHTPRSRGGGHLTVASHGSHGRSRL